MNISPISSWQGAHAVFTFGPDSFGMWLFLLVSILISVGVIARMVMHENHTFSEVCPDLLEGGAVRGANI